MALNPGNQLSNLAGVGAVLGGLSMLYGALRPAYRADVPPAVLPNLNTHGIPDVRYPPPEVHVVTDKDETATTYMIGTMYPNLPISTTIDFSESSAITSSSPNVDTQILDIQPTETSSVLPAKLTTIIDGVAFTRLVSPHPSASSEPSADRFRNHPIVEIIINKSSDAASSILAILDYALLPQAQAQDPSHNLPNAQTFLYALMFLASILGWLYKKSAPNSAELDMENVALAIARSRAKIEEEMELRIARATEAREAHFNDMLKEKSQKWQRGFETLQESNEKMRASNEALQAANRKLQAEIDEQSLTSPVEDLHADLKSILAKQAVEVRKIKAQLESVGSGRQKLGGELGSEHTSSLLKEVEEKVIERLRNIGTDPGATENIASKEGLSKVIEQVKQIEGSSKVVLEEAALLNTNAHARISNIEKSMKSIEGRVAENQKFELGSVSASFEKLVDAKIETQMKDLEVAFETHSVTIVRQLMEKMNERLTDIHSDLQSSILEDVETITRKHCAAVARTWNKLLEKETLERKQHISTVIDTSSKDIESTRVSLSKDFAQLSIRFNQTEQSVGLLDDSNITTGKSFNKISHSLAFLRQDLSKLGADVALEKSAMAEFKKMIGTFFQGVEGDTLSQGTLFTTSQRLQKLELQFAKLREVWMDTFPDLDIDPGIDMTRIQKFDRGNDGGFDSGGDDGSVRSNSSLYDPPSVHEGAKGQVLGRDDEFVTEEDALGFSWEAQSEDSIPASIPQPTDHEGEEYPEDEQDFSTQEIDKSDDREIEDAINQGAALSGSPSQDTKTTGKSSADHKPIEHSSKTPSSISITSKDAVMNVSKPKAHIESSLLAAPKSGTSTASRSSEKPVLSMAELEARYKTKSSSETPAPVQNPVMTIDSLKEHVEARSPTTLQPDSTSSSLPAIPTPSKSEMVVTTLGQYKQLAAELGPFNVNAHLLKQQADKNVTIEPADKDASKEEERTKGRKVAKGRKNVPAPLKFETGLFQEPSTDFGSAIKSGFNFTGNSADLTKSFSFGQQPSGSKSAHSLTFGQQPLVQSSAEKTENSAPSLGPSQSKYSSSAPVTQATKSLGNKGSPIGPTTASENNTSSDSTTLDTKNDAPTHGQPATSTAPDPTSNTIKDKKTADESSKNLQSVETQTKSSGITSHANPHEDTTSPTPDAGSPAASKAPSTSKKERRRDKHHKNRGKKR